MANYEVNQILRRVRQMQAFGQSVSSYNVRGAVRGALEASQERATRAAGIGLQQRGLELQERAQRENVRLTERAQEIQREGTKTAQEAQESQSLSGYMVGGSLLYSPLREMGVAGYELLAGAGGAGAGAGAGAGTFGATAAGTGSFASGVPGIGGIYSLGTGTGVTAGGAGAGAGAGGAGAAGAGAGAGAAGGGFMSVAAPAALAAAAMFLGQERLDREQKRGEGFGHLVTPWSDTGATGMIMNTVFSPITVPLAVASYVTESVGSFFSDAFGWG